MAHIDVMKTYRLELTPDEFRLVCGALREFATADALDLNRRLVELVHKQNTLAATASEHMLKSARDECNVSTS